ncbi:hypothetical protein D3C74_497160 [compost metagenome]
MDSDDPSRHWHRLYDHSCDIMDAWTDVENHIWNRNYDAFSAYSRTDDAVDEGNV